MFDSLVIPGIISNSRRKISWYGHLPRGALSRDHKLFWVTGLRTCLKESSRPPAVVEIASFSLSSLFTGNKWMKTLGRGWWWKRWWVKERHPGEDLKHFHEEMHTLKSRPAWPEFLMEASIFEGLTTPRYFIHGLDFPPNSFHFYMMAALSRACLSALGPCEVFTLKASVLAD